MGFTIPWHLWARMSFPQPNVCVPSNEYAYCTLPGVFPPPSVDAPVDVHGRSHNLPLIHPREVLLAGCWMTTWPLLSCGIITSSLPAEVGLHGVDWYICSMHDRHLNTRECQPLMQWEEVGFSGGCMTIHLGLSLCRRGCLSWSDVPPHMSPLPTYPWSSSFP